MNEAGEGTYPCSEAGHPWESSSVPTRGEMGQLHVGQEEHNAWEGLWVVRRTEEALKNLGGLGGLALKSK